MGFLRFCKKTIFFELLLVFTCQSICLSEQFDLPVSVSIQLNANYSKEEINSIENLIRNAGREGLPFNFLFPRIIEGAKKRVRYDQLLKVLDKKIGFMRDGNRIIWAQTAKGRKSVDINKSVSLLSELMERGLNEKEWNYLVSVSSEDIVLESIIDRARLLVILKENGYSSSAAAELAAAFFLTDLKSAENIVELLGRYPVSGAREIVVNDIHEKKSVKSIMNELKSGYRLETIKEGLGENSSRQ